MRTTDMHSDSENQARIKYELENEIRFAKRESDKLLCIISGYGSTGGTHKIRNYLIELLDEYKSTKRIKDYILGEDIDIFNVKYQSFIGKEKIPESIKKSHNKGIILVSV